MMTGLSVLLDSFSAPLNLSTEVLQHIRDMRVDQGQGVRQFAGLPDQVEFDVNKALVLRGSPSADKVITVTLNG